MLVPRSHPTMKRVGTTRDESTDKTSSKKKRFEQDQDELTDKIHVSSEKCRSKIVSICRISLCCLLF